MTNCIGHGGGHLPTGDMFAGLSDTTMLQFFRDEYYRRKKKVTKRTAKKTTKKTIKSKSKSIKSKKSKAKRK